MVPTLPPTSRFDDPSTGSQQTTRPLSGSRTGSSMGSGHSSETSAAHAPLSRKAASIVSWPQDVELVHGVAARVVATGGAEPAAEGRVRQLALDQHRRPPDRGQHGADSRGQPGSEATPRGAQMSAERRRSVGQQVYPRRRWGASRTVNAACHSMLVDGGRRSQRPFCQDCQEATTRTRRGGQLPTTSSSARRTRWGVGARVDQSGAGLIQGSPYAAPGEDLRLK